jgi:hypothetical protein
VLMSDVSGRPRSQDIVRMALAASLFGSFAALLVLGYRIARTRPVVVHNNPIMHRLAPPHVVGAWQKSNQHRF